MEDPFLVYRDWSGRLDRGISIHHCIPRSRPEAIRDASNFFGMKPNGQGWNKIRLDQPPHQLCHKMFLRQTPWEVISSLRCEEEIFDEWSIWHGFGWLIIFGKYSPKQAAEIISQANGNLPEIYLDLVTPQAAEEIILLDLTTPKVREYTKHVL